MQTSRFQLGLIATLAVGLGFSFASSDAVGYPAGAAVSMGANPVWSVGGTLVGTSPDTVLEPTGTVGIVTDVVVTIAGYCENGTSFQFTNSAGDVLGSFLLASDSHVGGSPGAVWAPTVVSHAFESGLSISDGDILKVRRGGGAGCELHYTLSGYYAQL
jgi:hypothetical protein